MSFVNSLLRYLGFSQSGIEELREALTVEDAGVDLYGKIGDVRVNEAGGRTAVFVVDLYAVGAGGYGSTEIEFALNGGGLDNNTELSNFLSNFGITSVAQLDDVIDTEVDVEFDANGNRVIRP